MSYTITVALQKGGTGKTTTTLNLGVELSNLGLRVLLIDIDPQSNLTTGVGFRMNSFKNTVYEVLHNPNLGAGFAVAQIDERLKLIPSSIMLAGAEMELSNRIGRELLLKKALAPLQKDFDFILIDTPPSLGLFTVNALAASNSVIAPLQAHTYAYQAMPQLEAVVNLVKDINPALSIEGILLTMIDRRTSLSAFIEKEAREKYGDKVFKTVIPLTIKLAEAPAAGEAVGLYAPNSPAARAYSQLAQEVKERFAHAA